MYYNRHRPGVIHVLIHVVIHVVIYVVIHVLIYVVIYVLIHVVIHHCGDAFLNRSPPPAIPYVTCLYQRHPSYQLSSYQ